MSSIVSRLWRVDVILFVGILASVALFHHRAPGWNVNSRLALTRSISEHRTIAIDAILKSDPEMETGDVARLRGQTFSDKTPGASFLALPAAYGIQLVETITGPVSTPVRRYWITLGSVGLALAAFGVLLRRLIGALMEDGIPTDSSAQVAKAGGSGTVAALVALGACVATPAFYYGSLLMSYAPMLALLTGAALLILRALPLIPQAGERPFRPGLLFGAGVLLGLAVLMEYIAGLAVAALGLWAWGRVAVAGGNRMVLRFLAVPLLLMAGAFVGWLPFAIYAQAAFGQVAIPYAYHGNDMFRAYMARGFMGIHAPNPTVAWLITVHPYRGLFVQAPWLGLGLLWGFLTVGGWLLSGRGQAPSQPPADPESGPQPPAEASELVGSSQPESGPSGHPGALLWILVSLLAMAAYLIFNAGYYMWWGGWSFAPRHLVPTIPFAAGCAALAWHLGRPLWRGAFLVGVTWAVLIQWTVMATDPQTPDIGRIGGTSLPRLLEPRLDSVPPWPWTRQVLPRMQAGATSYIYGGGALSGWVGLVPLLLVVGSTGFLVFRASRSGAGPQKGTPEGKNEP